MFRPFKPKTQFDNLMSRRRTQRCNDHLRVDADNQGQVNVIERERGREEEREGSREKETKGEGWNSEFVFRVETHRFQRIHT